MGEKKLHRRDEDLEEAILYLQGMRLECKERLNEKHGICNKELTIGSVVLLHNTRRKKDMSPKLAFKWLGLYQFFFFFLVGHGAKIYLAHTY